ncbi:hypothetical protein Poli38472_008940 [Pythium oligandrum]|uniref:Tubulin--tyrosine ligase-like protein 5 n=1 Tax=Pythium oligandrum TaxID=41045 RepID=A0A8K1C556_PYTOL|nr:hypothetical protein Poli38472_008940 [Pythium oligandrum]|eukprot:TMW56292.1 hypothetical protein Poli38472_008940 [Pythium oligandrum]
MLLLRVSTVVCAWVVGVTTAVPSGRSDARFYLTEEPRQEHKLLLEQLETLGIDRFIAPRTQDDPEKEDGWSPVSSQSDQFDLVWSLDAKSPFDQLSFSHTFRAKVNHLPGAERLTNTDIFHRHIVDNQRRKEKFFFNFVPKHFMLPRDEAKLPNEFEATRKKVQFELKRERDPLVYQRYLVRPVPKSGNDDALTPAVVVSSEKELQEKLQYEFKGQEVEFTQYLEPFLLDGHKFSAGFYVAVTSLDPVRVYVFDHALIKISKTAYPANLDVNSDRSTYNLNEYIPPWDFPDLQKYFYEFPSDTRPGTNAWKVVKRYLNMQGIDTKRLQREINDAIVKSVISSRGFLQSQVGNLKRFKKQDEKESERTDLSESFFELWRFDFELDDMGKPWLSKIHSNPSMTAEKSVFGTDEAIKKRVIFDLLNLVGVHPQASPSFDKFFRPQDAAFCADKCSDHSRVWDTACWSCPGWFAPYIARRLFDSMNEYARRGGFNLVYPSLDQDYSKFMDNALSELDIAFDRYIRSLSTAYGEKQTAAISDNVVVCVHREHCNDNGDCVNAKCKCDDNYEGSTCYIPKDKALDKRTKAERAGVAPVGESWKERVGNFWNRYGTPAPAQGALGGEDGAQTGATGQTAKLVSKPLSEIDRFSASKLLFGLACVTAFLVVAYRCLATNVETTDVHKDN